MSKNFVNTKGFVMGKKICIYVKDDAEADFVKAAIKQHRVGVDLLKIERPILSAAQQYMLDTVMNAINNIHGAQQPKVDSDKLFGVIED